MYYNCVFQQSIGSVMEAFIEQLHTPPVKLMIIGPSYTPQAEVMAETAPRYNLINVSVRF